MNAPSVFDSKILRRAIWNAVKKFNPVLLIQNPVIFITEIGAILTTIELFISPPSQILFILQISIWLWFTVLFANFAEALAESRNQAQAESLRSSRIELFARLIDSSGREQRVNANQLKMGDVVVVSAGEAIPGDGEIIEGIASIDESSVTGESNPVIRAAGSDHTGVLGGTKVLSDEIRIKIRSSAGESFLDRMIQLIEGAKRKRTHNELALTILLSGLTFIFLTVVCTFKIFGIYFHANISITMLVSLLICIIPTTIGGLLSAIGIAGINRLMKKRVLAMSGQAVEAAGDIDVVLIDKTGTITIGNRQANELIPSPGHTLEELAEAAYLASYCDQTGEGKSIIAWINENAPASARECQGAELVPFSASTRLSGVNIQGRQIRKGAIDSIEGFAGIGMSFQTAEAVRAISESGGTPLLVADKQCIFGVIHLKDIVKKGLAEQFQRLRTMGIRTIMITGDNPVTAAAIAKEAGVDEFRAQATPEDKLSFLFEQQDAGYLVAMTGDGVNDAPALAFANVGLAMNAGTQAAKEAGNMIDLESDPTKLFEIIEIGKQMLMTRGALTAFSIANDLAKYFAIIPALLIPLFPAFSHLNILNLSSPKSAVLSAVIFNALIIIALIPLAFRGIKFVPQHVSQILNRNLLIYGAGGIALPFIGIKAIDLLIHNLGLI
ncbi:MAG: Potassium-translocating P-type ATPase, subunit [Parachlamydiales bacterium]|nr:Potassium-translocating P-type ATPase, subunit [Parachlamydiales bacterium]